MHNKEQPYTCYAVTDTRTCLVCENSFEAIMHRLNGFYVPKKTARIESKGTRYEMGDFIIKIGIVSLGPHARGVLVEVIFHHLLDHSSIQSHINVGQEHTLWFIDV